MRTTLNIQDDLLEKAKQRALDRKCTLGEIVEDALRQSFARKTKGQSTRRTRLPTFRGRGLQPGVDLDSTASLLDTMEER
jgi:hypothetical protein